MTHPPPHQRDPALAELPEPETMDIDRELEQLVTQRDALERQIEARRQHSRMLGIAQVRKLIAMYDIKSWEIKGNRQPGVKRQGPN
jgi:hypothetical protein